MNINYKKISNNLIIFAGPIGAGKSTHIYTLAVYLKKNKIKVITTCIKSHHLLVNLILIFLVKLLKINKQKEVHPIRVLLESRPLAFRKLFKILAYLDLLSISIKYLFRIYLPSKLGYTILVEDYIVSTLADYAFHIMRVQAKFDLLKGLWLRVLIKLLYATPIVAYIYLDADNKVLVNRWYARGTPIDKPSYARAQRKLILRFLRLLNHSKSLIYIDSSYLSLRDARMHVISALTDIIVRQ